MHVLKSLRGMALTGALLTVAMPAAATSYSPSWDQSFLDGWNVRSSHDGGWTHHAAWYIDFFTEKDISWIWGHDSWTYDRHAIENLLQHWKDKFPHPGHGGEDGGDHGETPEPPSAVPLPAAGLLLLGALGGLGAMRRRRR